MHPLQLKYPQQRPSTERKKGKTREFLSKLQRLEIHFTRVKNNASCNFYTTSNSEQKTHNIVQTDKQMEII